ncbi:hypothetical protein CRG98_045010 [Punica granatum]|uniref:TOG domain-containing protein n=1 Tax=Punica granatum TaxID=22663 RepID=A0A2I0HTL4_PUNGR|nr:hypothetical protein CRG98_045010 [Punica granatum]
MKTQVPMKARGPSRASNQQVMLELKQKVVFALNKLADRDTYKIGVEELDKIAERMTPEAIASFLSCILDTDSEQKSAVRKECIRLMGTLARLHEGLIGPYIGKIVSSIVKRLKDPDSVVRDACVETMGTLALKLVGHIGQGDGVFVMLVRPLFEALGEQNKQVQSGAGLCLARVIDNTHDPPTSLLQRMLARTVKLLKNPHFMAKPAVIELNRSIIQAGGATAQNVLTAAITSIQEALKSTDWATRKAASVALGEIALSSGPFLGSFRASCIRCLELCRFDKVKPVRDSVAQALHCWRSLPGPTTPDPSEAGSSIKDSFFGGEYSDVTNAIESRDREPAFKKVFIDSTKKKVPRTVSKIRQNYTENSQHNKPEERHIEIAVPNSKNISSVDFTNEESDGSCVSKSAERLTVPSVKSKRYVIYESPLIDEKQECGSVTNIAAGNLETKSVRASQECLEDGSLLRSVTSDLQFVDEEISSVRHSFMEKIQDRRSLDSTVTESSYHTQRDCCVQMANEMACIRKQLSEIENKQSNLMDLLQVFTKSSAESLSVIKSKVLALEQAVCRINRDFMHGDGDPYTARHVAMKNNGSNNHLKLSTCTPRPSVEIHSRHSTVRKKAEVWEDKALAGSRLSNSSKQDIDMWASPAKSNRTQTGRVVPKCSGQGPRAVDNMNGETNAALTSQFSPIGRKTVPYNKNSLWNRVKDFLCEGDVDSAYMEALLSGNEQVLVELLNGTGPVLESLSQKTASEVLIVLVSFFIEQRYVKPIMLWLQQVVDLSSLHGPNYFLLPMEVKQELISAVQEAVNMDFSSSMERRSVLQIAAKLQQIWGKRALNLILFGSV